MKLQKIKILKIQIIKINKKIKFNKMKIIHNSNLILLKYIRWLLIIIDIYHSNPKDILEIMISGENSDYPINPNIVCFW